MEKSLTGQWIGRYDYADGEPAVPFEADIVQDGMTIRATTREPNTFRATPAPELQGYLTGWIIGTEVRLTKTYTFDQGSDPEYVGRVDPSCRRIRGRWSFEDLPGINGNFTLTRNPPAEARARRRIAAEIEI